MSRLSPDLIDVALAPSGIQLVRHSQLTRRQRARPSSAFRHLASAPYSPNLMTPCTNPTGGGAGGLRLILSITGCTLR